MPSNQIRQIFISVFAHDGWKAWGHGKELPISKVDSAFMSILVPAGIDKIELTYGSDWKKIIIIISFLTLLLSILFAVVIKIKCHSNK